MILVLQQQEVYAFNLSCPHQNAAVRWNAAGQDTAAWAAAHVSVA